MLSRRHLLALAVLMGGCARREAQPVAQRSAAPGPGRLTVRPPAGGPSEAGRLGLLPLGLEQGRDGLVYVPEPADRPPLLVAVLHGAGGAARGAIDLLLPLADSAGVLLVAPDSRGRTWDVILGEYGPDVAFLDAALRRVLAQHAVDPARIAVGGFSDGASYALSLGLTNGDLFTDVLAFSPGFSAPADQLGRPRVFVSHGTRDQVLPIDRCSRRIVPALQRAGYDVRYREFDGGHTVPPDIAREAVDALRD